MAEKIPASIEAIDEGRALEQINALIETAGRRIAHGRGRQTITVKITVHTPEENASFTKVVYQGKLDEEPPRPTACFSFVQDGGLVVDQAVDQRNPNQNVLAFEKQEGAGHDD